VISVMDATETPASDDSEPQIDTPRVAALGVHPVKSLRGIEPDVWQFDDRGPRLDRRWMLVDADDRFVSLREEPRLARCHVGLLDPDAPLPGLRLSWDGDEVEVRPADDADHATTTATLWGASRVVIDEGDEVADWLSSRLGRAVRLRRHLPDRDPWTQPDPPAEGATTGLSDGYPVLVLATATISAAVGPAFAARRFRANILVSGVPAHAEDRWRRIRIGKVELELVKPCVRCVATTVDPETGTRTGTEPLSTLARTRTWNGKPVLGWNALVRTSGEIRQGSPITVLATRSVGEEPVQTVGLDPTGAA
jgi:uncharacterized protein YcbX